MPNTLVHLGVQSVSSKAVFRGADFKWIGLACILPDIPWIIQRLVFVLSPGIDPYLLRTHVIVQSSLLFCFFLAGAVSLLSDNSRKVFLLLAANAVLHLLLDALQIKWANGILLFAPLSWSLTGLQLVWPENVLVYCLTVAGLVAALFFGYRDRNLPVLLKRHRGKYVAALFLVLLYAIAPVWLRSLAWDADNHYVATLAERSARTGKYLELDRALFHESDQTIQVFTGELLKAEGTLPKADALVSVQGSFIDPGTISVAAFHVHSKVRDYSSMIGLGVVLLFWLAALFQKKVSLLS